MTDQCPVCRGDVPLVDGLLVQHRHRDQFGPCPAGQVLTDAQREWMLKEAERHMRDYAARGVSNNPAVVLLAEYDRMRAELTKTVADCGICRLGGRTIHISDDCPRHGDTDGEA